MACVGAVMAGMVVAQKVGAGGAAEVMGAAARVVEEVDNTEVGSLEVEGHVAANLVAARASTVYANRSQRSRCQTDTWQTLIRHHHRHMSHRLSGASMRRLCQRHGKCWSTTTEEPPRSHLGFRHIHSDLPSSMWRLEPVAASCPSTVFFGGGRHAVYTEQ